jgi:hypothetical protein
MKGVDFMEKPASANIMRPAVNLSGLMLSILFFFGCSLFFPPVTAKIAWQAGPAVAKSARSAPKGVETDQRFTEYYSSIGTRVGTCTPTKFRIPVPEVLLISSKPVPFSLDPQRSFQLNLFGYRSMGDVYKVTDNDIHADFAAAVTIASGKEAAPTIYDSMVLWISGSNGKMGYGGTAANPAITWHYTHDITVVLPGYTDVEFPNIESHYNGELSGYQRYYLGNDTFRYTWNELIPKFHMTPGHPLMVDTLIFNSNLTGNDLVVAGRDGAPEIISASSYCTNPNASTVSGNGSMMLAPFKAVDLAGLSSVTYTVRLDLENIIEIWDNNTSTDKSDDIVVFTNGFWNRFSLAVE